jgi:membrane protein YqaA with SNARE-associated domain
MDTETSLAALFAASFLAATLLPGGSEAVLFGVLKLHPDSVWPALTVATLGNTLGGMSSWLIGRLLPREPLPARLVPYAGTLARLQRYGSPALLAAWVPFIGDPLCVAAGWLRVNPWTAAAFMAVGKAARYAVITAAAV